jgi:hypothetical protein
VGSNPADRVAPPLTRMGGWPDGGGPPLEK